MLGLPRTCSTLLRAPALRQGLAGRMNICQRYFSSYPPHSVLPMPALSPTMVQGNVAQWMLKEGDSIEPGAVICEIETDKATVDFEAQDDGFLAKILKADGSSDIPVGEPIGIVVEEKEDIDAFANYVVEDSDDSSPVNASDNTQNESAKSSKEVDTKPVEPKPIATPIPPATASPPTPAAPEPAPKPAEDKSEPIISDQAEKNQTTSQPIQLRKTFVLPEMKSPLLPM